MNNLIRVYNLKDRVVLVPLSTNDPAVEIEKCSPYSLKSLRIETLGALDQECDANDEKLDAFGVVGMIQLIRSAYLILITGKKHVGSVRGHDIWKLTDTLILPLSQTNLLTARQKQDEETYLSMIRSVLSQDFYFSYSFHLTHSLQRLSHMKDAGPVLHRQADPRFFWNAYLMKNFIEAGLDRWVLPITMGFAKIETVEINVKKFDFILFSRRNINRAGTRYTRRGCDPKGDAANNVETEQIVVHQDNVEAFVQTRGSVPVVWRQNPTLKYNPPIRVAASNTVCFNAFQTHVRKQMEKYGKQVLVSLIDQKGRELGLYNSYVSNGNAFNQSNSSQQIKVFHYDFHHETKGMKYENLNKLLDQVTTYIDEFGWFNSKDQFQTGVIRTNCVDNLDRTNVVQTMFAQYVLNKQLQRMGILNGAETIANFDYFLSIFKNVWADNADAISTQYSGTGALKNDFTRTGKRNLAGMINDGVNSVTRYFLNNFYDGFRQDAFDLFLGNYQVEERQTNSPLQKKDQEKNLLNFIVLAVGVLVIVLSLFTPSNQSFLGKLATLAIWGGGFFGLYKVALKYGEHVVDKPCLVDDRMEN
eukprot:TRINITY_DN5363_c0_g1_i1.p1 TRINITY_DN5363_c0_g1~~TRINITY_DN5363_c0_g1_i1.p1  ORF type:complete len:602 (-),score=219.09 TRINITY_DN5363_c0_g1_i1:139-1899(-)